VCQKVVIVTLIGRPVTVDDVDQLNKEEQGGPQGTIDQHK
jgi:hypothetical protein